MFGHLSDGVSFCFQIQRVTEGEGEGDLRKSERDPGVNVTWEERGFLFFLSGATWKKSG